MSGRTRFLVQKEVPEGIPTSGIQTGNRINRGNFQNYEAAHGHGEETEMICPRCQGRVFDGICINCGYDGGAITKPQSLGPKVERGSLPNKISHPLNLPDDTTEVIKITKTPEKITEKPPIITKSEEIMPENMPNQLPDVPPKPKGSAWIIKKYYDDNRIQIENEINEYGLYKILRRWGIASGMWTGIKRRWTGLTRGHESSGTPPVAKKKLTPEKETEYQTPIPHNDREMVIFLNGWQMGAEAMRG